MKSAIVQVEELLRIAIIFALFYSDELNSS